VAGSAAFLSYNKFRPHVNGHIKSVGIFVRKNFTSAKRSLIIFLCRARPCGFGGFWAFSTGISGMFEGRMPALQ
jgi:hypothetical protein